MYTYFDIYENLRTSIGTLKHLLKFNKQAFSFLCVYMYMYSEKKQIKHQEIKNTLNAKCVLIYIYIKKVLEVIETSLTNQSTLQT